MAMRVIAISRLLTGAALAATGCAAGTPAAADGVTRTNGPCSLGLAADELLGPSDAVDCGSLRVDADQRTTDAAHACMKQALTRKAPFLLRWDEQGVDSFVGAAFVGRANDDAFEVFTIHYDGCPMGCGADDPRTYTYRCRELVDLRSACRPPSAGGGARQSAEVARICEERQERGVRKVEERVGYACTGARRRAECGRAMPDGVVVVNGE